MTQVTAGPQCLLGANPLPEPVVPQRPWVHGQTPRSALALGSSIPQNRRRRTTPAIPVKERLEVVGLVAPLRRGGLVAWPLRRPPHARLAEALGGTAHSADSHLLPCLIEESIFRGILLPPSLAHASTTRRAVAVISSTGLFVAMHPLNHWLVGLSDSAFTNPTFLLIVALLGLTCAVQYLKTRSLWIPIATHWATVVAWNLFFGRDLAL